jgi:SUMO ligase MMS21 Smc5/6 complex component
LATATSTLQPINWDEGFVKDVLYDKVFIIRNNLSVQVPGGGTTPNIPQSGNMFHFKKYIKYPHAIKYTDNNTSSPNSTDKPIYVVISAEVDDSNTGLIPSTTNILYSTGYTRAWFKDA